MSSSVEGQTHTQTLAHLKKKKKQERFKGGLGKDGRRQGTWMGRRI